MNLKKQPRSNNMALEPQREREKMDFPNYELVKRYLKCWEEMENSTLKRERERKRERKRIQNEENIQGAMLTGSRKFRKGF
jgi:hypothetical protein